MYKITDEMVERYGQELIDVAIHEAGHAVVTYILYSTGSYLQGRWKIEGITIDPHHSDGSGGKNLLIHSGLGLGADPFQEDAIYMAGLAANLRYDHSRGINSPWREAKHHQGASSDKSKIRLSQSRGLSEARTYLRANFHLVEGLALALMRSPFHSLTGPQVLESFSKIEGAWDEAKKQERRKDRQARSDAKQKKWEEKHTSKEHGPLWGFVWVLIAGMVLYFPGLLISYRSTDSGIASVMVLVGLFILAIEAPWQMIQGFRAIRNGVFTWKQAPVWHRVVLGAFFLSLVGLAVYAELDTHQKETAVTSGNQLSEYEICLRAHDMDHWNTECHFVP